MNERTKLILIFLACILTLVVLPTYAIKQHAEKEVIVKSEDFSLNDSVTAEDVLKEMTIRERDELQNTIWDPARGYVFIPIAGAVLCIVIAVLMYRSDKKRTQRLRKEAGTKSSLD